MRQSILIGVIVVLFASTVGLGIAFAELNSEFDTLNEKYGYAMELSKFFQNLNDPEHNAIVLEPSSNDFVI